MLNNLNPICSKEIQKQRVEICFKCPDMGMIPVLGTAKCNACGCPIRSKVAVKVSSCPKGKW